MKKNNVFLLTIASVFMILFWACSHHHHHHAEEKAEFPSVALTVWTEKTELFMEFRHFVAGSESSFAAHLTTMHDFKAVEEGRLSIKIVMENGSTYEAVSEKTSSPGIFRFKITPENPGKCTISISYEGQGITDEINAGACQVFRDEKDVLANVQEAEDEGIAYLKEQQWKTDFATRKIEKLKLQPTIQTMGEILPASGKRAVVSAPSRGNIILAKQDLAPGIEIKKGTLLATIQPFFSSGNMATLTAEVSSYSVKLLNAESNLSRKERLFKDGAVSKKDVEEAVATVEIFRAQLLAARERHDQLSNVVSGKNVRSSESFKLRAPIDGTLVSLNTAFTDSVEEGAKLFEIIDSEKVWLSVKIFETDIPNVTYSRSAWFYIEGYETPFEINETNGKLLSIGRIVDPSNRTITALFEFNNPDNKIKIGQFARVLLYAGEEKEVVAIPESAIINDAGKQVVFIHQSGELFSRRIIKTGTHSRDMVEIVSGVQEGERVVTTGAYDIHLFSSSGAIPEHGHVH